MLLEKADTHVEVLPVYKIKVKLRVHFLHKFVCGALVD